MAPSNSSSAFRHSPAFRYASPLAITLARSDAGAIASKQHAKSPTIPSPVLSADETARLRPQCRMLDYAVRVPSTLLYASPFRRIIRTSFSLLYGESASSDSPIGHG